MTIIKSTFVTGAYDTSFFVIDCHAENEKKTRRLPLYGQLSFTHVKMLWICYGLSICVDLL